jgi:hypothetical protein
MCQQCFRQYTKDINFSKLEEVFFLEWLIQDIYSKKKAMPALYT